MIKAFLTDSQALANTADIDAILNSPLNCSLIEGFIGIVVSPISG